MICGMLTVARRGPTFPGPSCYVGMQSDGMITNFLQEFFIWIKFEIFDFKVSYRQWKLYYTQQNFSKYK